ncbi:MAG: polysaccharide biosynthesis tyrosine autokinase [Alphaproteobacteria bacterium]|nr:polysaccharide biosynthesis tyrosine autokinase [Alphaproteobacteria bacterium]
MGLDTNVRQALAALRSDGAVEAMPETDFDLRRLMLVVWRARWFLALFTVLGIGYAYAQLLRITPLYTAESRVLWEIDQANFVDIDPVTQGLRGDYFSLASQIEVIESGRLLNRVVTDLELAKDPVFNASLRPPEGWTRWLSLTNAVAEARAYVFGAKSETVVEETPEALQRRMVSALRGAVQAEWLDGTYVLIIRMTTSNPERSAELANEMARFYMLDQLETKFEAMRQATNWLTERVADLRVALESAEQSVESFASGMTLVSEEALAASARQLKDLRERAVALGDEQVETASRLEAVAAARAEGDFAAVAALMRELRLASLADEIGRLDQPAQNVQRETMIARFDAEFERARTRMAFAIERLKGQEGTVRDTVVELEQKQSVQAKALLQLRQLQREAEASRLIYEFFLSRLKETSVQEGIQRPDARILTEADVPGRASSPRRGITLLTGGGGGLLLALALVFLFERLNNSFRSTEELESRTGHAVIGTIPMAPTSRRRAFLQYLIDKPTSSVAEAIRNLRTSILLANVDDPPQVIMLVSALPGEGKTTCCIALAQISKALGKRVLLVECDLRRRTFRNYFDLPVRDGLLSVLSGAKSFEDIVYHDENSGLYILPGEESSVNAADIFASQRFTDFIAEMRQEFDFIFIDTPPVLAVPDARVIAKNSDAVIFCVRWNKTAREAVTEGLRFFAQIHIKVAGLVLSQVNVNKMARYGYSSYGYYKEAVKYYHN